MSKKIRKINSKFSRSKAESTLTSGVDEIFGDGSDGSHTISSGNTEYLQSDKYYTNLTIESGATLFTNGFRIFVNDRLTNNGTLGMPQNIVQTSNSSTISGRSDLDFLYSWGSGGSLSEGDIHDLEKSINGYIISTDGSIYSIGGGAAGEQEVYDVTDPGEGDVGQDGSPGEKADADVGEPGGPGNPGATGNPGNPAVLPSGNIRGKGGGVILIVAKTISGNGSIESYGTGYSIGNPGSQGNPGTVGVDGNPAPNLPSFYNEGSPYPAGVHAGNSSIPTGSHTHGPGTIPGSGPIVSNSGKLSHNAAISGGNNNASTHNHGDVYDPSDLYDRVNSAPFPTDGTLRPAGINAGSHSHPAVGSANDPSPVPYLNGVFQALNPFSKPDSNRITTHNAAYIPASYNAGYHHHGAGPTSSNYDPSQGAVPGHHLPPASDPDVISQNPSVHNAHNSAANAPHPAFNTDHSFRYNFSPDRPAVPVFYDATDYSGPHNAPSNTAHYNAGQHSHPADSPWSNQPSVNKAVLQSEGPHPANVNLGHHAVLTNHHNAGHYPAGYNPGAHHHPAGTAIPATIATDPNAGNSYSGYNSGVHSHPAGSSWSNQPAHVKSLLDAEGPHPANVSNGHNAVVSSHHNEGNHSGGYNPGGHHHGANANLPYTIRSDPNSGNSIHSHNAGHHQGNPHPSGHNPHGQHAAGSHAPNPTSNHDHNGNAVSGHNSTHNPEGHNSASTHYGDHHPANPHGPVPPSAKSPHNAHSVHNATNKVHGHTLGRHTNHIAATPHPSHHHPGNPYTNHNAGHHPGNPHPSGHNPHGPHAAGSHAPNPTSNHNHNANSYNSHNPGNYNHTGGDHHVIASLPIPVQLVGHDHNPGGGSLGHTANYHPSGHHAAFGADNSPSYLNANSSVNSPAHTSGSHRHNENVGTPYSINRMAVFAPTSSHTGHDAPSTAGHTGTSYTTHNHGYYNHPGGDPAVLFYLPAAIQAIGHDHNPGGFSSGHSANYHPSGDHAAYGADNSPVYVSTTGYMNLVAYTSGSHRHSEQPISLPGSSLGHMFDFSPVPNHTGHSTNAFEGHTGHQNYVNYGAGHAPIPVHHTAGTHQHTSGSTFNTSIQYLRPLSLNHSAQQNSAYWEAGNHHHAAGPITPLSGPNAINAGALSEGDFYGPGGATGGHFGAGNHTGNAYGRGHNPGSHTTNRLIHHVGRNDSANYGIHIFQTTPVDSPLYIDLLPERFVISTSSLNPAHHGPGSHPHPAYVEQHGIGGNLPAYGHTGTPYPAGHNQGYLNVEYQGGSGGSGGAGGVGGSFNASGTFNPGSTGGIIVVTRDPGNVQNQIGHSNFAKVIDFQ